MSKKFCPRLYKENDDKGKQTALHFFKQLGYTLYDDREAYKSHDFIVSKNNEKQKVEVEVARSWTTLAFPYPNMTIPYRKKDSKADVFIQTNLNGSALIMCPMKSVLNARVITKNTIYTKDEKFFSLPISTLRQFYCEDGIWYEDYVDEE